MPGRPSSYVVLLGAVALVVAGCTGDPIAGRAVGGPSGSVSQGPSGSIPPTPTAPTGTLTWGETSGAVTNLLPVILDGNTTSTLTLTSRVLDGLFRTTPGITFVPDTDQGTATSDIEGGKQVVDITIDPDAVWADGRPITAADYAFTIDAQKSLVAAEGGCPGLLSTAGYDQVERTQSLGDKELKIYFDTPYADWRGLFAGGSSPLLSQHVIDQGSASATCAYLTKGWPVAGGIPLGAQNGPWLLTDAGVDTTTRTITLVPNPRYWGDKPKLAKLVHRQLDSADDAVSALGSGAIDVATPPADTDTLGRLRQQTGVTSRIGVGSGYEHLDFNVRDPLLRMPQIRQAIAAAIDRPSVVAVTAGKVSGEVRPLGNRLLLSSQQGYRDNAGTYAGRDVARAKNLIESVGGKLAADGYYRVGGRPLSFRVMTTVGNAQRDQTIKLLATQVQTAGIKLTEFASPDIFRPSGAGSLAGGRFQMALFAWVGAPTLSSADTLYRSPAQGGSQNFGHGADPVVDRYLTQVVTAESPTAQNTAANAADAQLWRDMFTLPLFQKPVVVAFRTTVSGLTVNDGPSGPLWNSDDLTVR